MLPKHYWEAKGANGEPRDITKTTMEIPLGSGPYKIKEFDAGRSITYERVKDYWAKDLPVSKGQWNFDEIKLTYFLDRTPAFEEFKSGKLDYWRENVASQWATAYDFAAVKNGLGQEGGDPDRAACDARCRRSSSTCAASSSRIRACARAFALAYQFRGSQQEAVLSISTSAPRATSTIPSSPAPACRRAVSSRS